MIGWPDYAAHARFVAPARASAAPWRLLLGLVVAAVAYFVLGTLYIDTIWQLTFHDAPGFAEGIIAGRTPGTMLALLASFGLMIVAVIVPLRFLHRRGPLSLIGPLPLALRQFRQVMVALVLLNLVILVLPPWGMGAPLRPNLSPGLWIALLPLSLIGVLVETGAEEVVFRGYVQQQLAARFASPWVWMVLPAALFAWGHYLPAEAGGNALAVALCAGVFGLLMADITARAGTLGPAIALHFVNNVSAMLLVSLEGDLSGLALFLAPFGMADEAALRAWLPVDLAWMGVSWLAARLALRR